MVVFDRYIEKIIKGKRVLSIGCAGYLEARSFSRQFQKLKRKADKLYGLDIDKDFISKYNQDHNLFHGDLNKFNWFDQLPKDIEIIIMTEVLEHLEAPVKTLRYIKTKKNKDCKLLISAPNGGSFGRFILGILKARMFYFQDRHHLCVFNRVTIENCCKKAGLKVIEVKPYIHSAYHRILMFPHLASGFFVLCE